MKLNIKLFGKKSNAKAKKNNTSKIKPSIKTNNKVTTKEVNKTIKKEFPKKFPFWARLKISKNRTTLVIDEEQVLNKNSKKIEDGFVHREATSIYKQEYEKLEPNPDKTLKKPMYLKKATKLPKVMFKTHNKKLDMSEELIERYDINNKKK